MLFEFRVDVVADVVPGQELDAVGETYVEGQAVDVADSGDAEAGDEDVKGVAGGARGFAAPSLQLISVSQDGVFVVLQALGGPLSALGFFRFALGDPFLVALFVVHGFLHACAALRGRMRHNDELVGLWLMGYG